LARSRKVIGYEAKPRYVVEDYRNPPKSQIIGYRRKKLPSGHILTLAILRRKGPRGGRTVVTSLWHPRTERDLPKGYKRLSSMAKQAVRRAARKRRG